MIQNNILNRLGSSEEDKVNYIEKHHKCSINQLIKYFISHPYCQICNKKKEVNNNRTNLIIEHWHSNEYNDASGLFRSVACIRCNNLESHAKKINGMSSRKAMIKHTGKMNNYRTEEGKVVKIKHRGSVRNTVEDFLGGLRSTMTYVGCKNIQNLYRKTNFIYVNQQVSDTFNKTSEI